MGHTVGVMPGPSNVEPLRLRLRVALAAAMKARDAAAVAALRSALGAIDNAEAIVPPPASRATSGVIAGAVTGHGAGEMARHDLSETCIAEIVRAEVADRQTAAAEYEGLGRGDHATRLRAEAAALSVILDLC